MKKFTIITLGTIALLIAGAFLGVQWFTWRAEPTEVIAEMNKFQAPSEWKLVKETIHPKMNVCLDYKQCNFVSRSWDTGRIYSKNEINTIFKRQNLSNIIEYECTLDEKDTNDRKSLCSGSYKNSIYYYDAYYTQKNNQNILEYYVQSIE